MPLLARITFSGHAGFAPVWQSGIMPLDRALPPEAGPTCHDLMVSGENLRFP